MSFKIRNYTKADCNEIVTLFYDTVHSVNAKDYTEEQLNAWADGNADLKRWNASFLEHDTLVAVKDGKIVGFADMDESGYLDRLYVHKDCQRQGIATALCDELESRVRAERIETHASITARPFFEARGYRVVKEQQVVRKGVTLTNYVMVKEGDAS